MAVLNYKLTLAFTMNNGMAGNDDNDDNEDNNASTAAHCLGGIMDVTIYRVLPHAGLGLSVSLWEKEFECDNVVALGLTTVEVKRANANRVVDAIKEEREGMEPDS